MSLKSRKSVTKVPVVTGELAALAGSPANNLYYHLCYVTMCPDPSLFCPFIAQDEQEGHRSERLTRMLPDHHYIFPMRREVSLGCYHDIALMTNIRHFCHSYIYLHSYTPLKPVWIISQSYCFWNDTHSLLFLQSIRVLYSHTIPVSARVTAYAKVRPIWWLQHRFGC